MAGTLLLLKEAGYETHYFNLLSGNGGSAEYSGAATRRIRRQEAKRAATLIGAHWHAPIGDDLELVYSTRTSAGWPPSSETSARRSSSRTRRRTTWKIT